MTMQWLMGRFAPSYDNTLAPEPEEEEAIGVFHRFSDLPTELRLQIWEYYFAVPRLHALYPGPSSQKENKMSVACADITAHNNRSMPSSRRFAAAAINHEALEVFRKTFDLTHLDFMSLPSKHVRDLFDDERLRATEEGLDLQKPPNMPSEEALRSDPGLAELIRNPSGKPHDQVMPAIHVNWERDMLYLTDSADVNCEMLRRVCNSPVAGKLRRVAMLIHNVPDRQGWRPFYGPSVDFPKPTASLEEVVLVVLMDDLESTIVSRDEFGFAAYDVVLRGQKKEPASWEWEQKMKQIERRFIYVTQVMREAFPDLEDHKIKWAVDIDYDCHKSETRYSRKSR